MSPATLLSPGVQVTIIDESFYNSAGQGTIPLFVIATASNKQSPTAGGGTAPQTVPAQAGVLYLATSQQDLLQSFGNPIFYSVQGTPLQGYELNEYGLWSAYSYLGVANQAYILRGDLDLSQLQATTTAPVGPPTNGTYWFDLADTRWGVFRSNGSTSAGSAWNLVTVSVAMEADVNDAFIPLSTYGSIGDVAVVPLTVSNYLYENLLAASFTGTIAPISMTTTSTLTVTAGPTFGALAIGQLVTGAGVTAGTVIISGSGSSWVVSNSQTVASPVAMAASQWFQIATPTSGPGGTKPNWYSSHPTVVTGTAVTATLIHNNTININGSVVTVTTSPYHIADIVTDINTAAITNITASQAVNNALVITNTAGGPITISNGTGDSLTALGIPTGALFTGSITGSALSVTALSGGYSASPYVGQYLSGTNVTQWTQITGFVTATYTVSASQTVVSETITGTNGVFTGSISATTLTVTAMVGTGFINIGDAITGVGVTGGTTVTAFVSASYVVNYPQAVGSTTITAGTNNGVYVIRNNGPSYPVGVVANSFWVKGNPANNGADWDVKYYNGTLAQWQNLTAPFYPFNSLLSDGNAAKDAAAISAIPNPASGTIYVGFDVVTGDQQIRRWSGSQWQSLVYEADLNAPSTAPTAGTYWYNTDFQVDIMYGNGENWLGYRHQFPFTDPNGPQIDGSAPTTQSDGTTALADGDLWIDSSNLEEYPVIGRWSIADQAWITIDNSDHTTPFGIIFEDARSTSGTTFTGILNSGSYSFNSVAPADMALSDFVDPDAPDPRTYPSGMLLFNTRYATYNVKIWEPSWWLPGGFSPNTNYTTTTYNVGTPYETVVGYTFPALTVNGTWVTNSGNDITTGAPYMGRKAQRIEVVRALSDVVTTNQDIRSEIVFFNIMAAPGYVELISEFVALNTDMKEISFTVADTPIRLTPDGTSIQNWATNANDVATNSEEGLVSTDPYTAVYYPWGLSTNVDGTEIMIPPSAIAMVTMAINDQLAYPWYAPAGFTRGLVVNATSVGYLSADGLYVPTILNNGQRDVLYTNNINPIAYIPKRGLTVFGQKTLYGIASALNRINVSRLMNYISYNLNQILQPFLFEQNVTTTRSTVLSTVSRFFNSLVGLNGLYDYAVVCDTTNNTPERIDQNELWVDCAVQPVKSIEFIYVPVRIYNSSVNAATQLASEGGGTDYFYSPDVQ